MRTRALSITGILVPAGIVLVALAMFVGARQPLLGLAVALLIPFVMVLAASSTFRLAAIVGGALLVFQGSANGPKFAYLAVAILCLAMSALSLYSDASLAAQITRPFLVGAALVSVVIAVSFGVAQGNGIGLSVWFRDVLAYILIVALPVVGIDAGRRLQRSTIDRTVVALGVLAAFGFATDYLNRRGVSSLGIGRILLATPTLAALGFVHALVVAARKDTRTVYWMSAAVAIATLLIVTGTRTNLVLILAFPALIGARRKARIPVAQLLSLLIPVLVMTALLVPFLGAKLINKPGFLRSRLDAAVSVVQNGGASGDQSFIVREQNYHWAREQFDLGRWLGTGPGHAYPNGNTSLDTPWLILAKFGIIGTAAVLLYLSAAMFTVVRSRRFVGYQYSHTTVRGWAVVLAGFTPFGTWTEDKGFALALALVMAMQIAYTRDPVDAREKPLRSQGTSVGGRASAPGPHRDHSARLSGWRVDTQPLTSEPIG